MLQQQKGVNNIGTTEMVTTKILPADILGYFEIRDTKRTITTTLYTELKDLAEIEGYKDIPEEDVDRYSSFMATKGSIQPQSKFM